MSDNGPVVYDEVLQFRCSRDLKEMLQGDPLNAGLPLGQVAALRLQVVYGLTEGPNVAHRPTQSGEQEPQQQPRSPTHVPPATPPEETKTAIRDRGDGENMPDRTRGMSTIEVVAHLSRQVLAANSMQVLELRDSRLWPLANSGMPNGIVERLEAEGLALDDGIAGNSIARNKIWFGPVKDPQKGTMEQDYQSVACAPIVVTERDGTPKSPVYGLLFLGYERETLSTPPGRANMRSFATALARIWGLYG